MPDKSITNNNPINCKFIKWLTKSGHNTNDKHKNEVLVFGLGNDKPDCLECVILGEVAEIVQQIQNFEFLMYQIVQQRMF